MTVWPCDGPRAPKKDTYGSQKPVPRPDIGANVVIIKYYLFHETYTNLMKFCVTGYKLWVLITSPIH